MLAVKVPKKQAGLGRPAGNNVKLIRCYSSRNLLSRGIFNFSPQTRKVGRKPANRVESRNHNGIGKAN